MNSELDPEDKISEHEYSEDEFGSSSDSDEETNALLEGNVKHNVTIKDRIKSGQAIPTYQDHTELNINKIMEDNIPVYEDVTLMINSNIPFLIDADALIMYAFLQDNHECDLGGQFLHVVYYCERFLSLLLEKGGHFIIIFFKVWGKFWKKNSYINCLRLAVYKHFKETTNCKVLTFPTFNSKTFQDFLDIEKPRCVLLNISYHCTLEDFNKRTGADVANKLFANVESASLINCAEIIFFRANDLPCIDITEINISECVVFSFNLHTDVRLIVLNRLLCRKLVDTDTDISSTSSDAIVNCDYSGYDARRALVVISSSNFLQSVEDVNKLKLILLCYAAQEVLPLENRCCPVFKFNTDSLQEVHKDVLTWLDCLTLALTHCMRHQIALEWHTIADLWQATLFSYVCYLAQETIDGGSKLGRLQEAYEHYIQMVKIESNKDIEPYPILPLNAARNGTLLSSDISQGKDEMKLYLLNNPLIRSFCGDSFQDVAWRTARKNVPSEEFNEIRHWHCNKPMTDEYDHVKDANIWREKPQTKAEFEKYDFWKKKELARYAHYLDIYGRNLEGNKIKSETIVCQNNGIEKKKIKKDKERKKVKEGKKVHKVTQQIIDEKAKKKLDEQFESIKNLKTKLKIDPTLSSLKDKLNEVTFVFKKLTAKETILAANLLKLKLYKDHIKNLKPETVNIEIVEDVFLIIRSILQDNSDMISDKDKNLLSKLLCTFGFHEIVTVNNLPMDIKYIPLSKLNWVHFQLQYLGPHMERLTGGVFDTDVGFAPDPWQAKFIDAIRKKQSALVVAPTSSGKTFAAYYCMKRVLQESPDGVVVYVAPTKALVNQAEATVHARFKNAKQKDGTVVVGVFTRDYKRNPLNARILITVPQCLDILLLSPRRYTWAKNLKYVIFDEVHKLSGNEGLVWERCLLLISCPFLALSATISDVPEFHKWLQSNENFKKEQDRLHGRTRDSYEVVLVEHQTRHSDLVKYVFNEETDLQHYHPYCALDAKILKLHDGVPSTIYLSPFEVLQLHNVMQANASLRAKLTGKRDLFNFFSAKSKDCFISRNDVSEYERILAEVFFEAHKENGKNSLSIIRKLLPEKTSLRVSKLEEIPALLNCMHKRNMLPCIVFSYNRDHIEMANYLMIEECKKIEPTETNRRDEKAKEKIAKMEKKLREKEEGSNKDQSTRSQRPIKPSNILKFTGSKFKGHGLADSYDMTFIERRLKKSECDPLFLEGLPYGVAYHHGGLNNKQRSTVEILFRQGILRAVFATGTLALGIHMPCKSIVVFGDSPFLNSIEFHQMSGRAGRRGFDTEGNVIFAGLTKKRQDMLMTDKLPKMLGNFPVSVTLIARLLLLVTKVTHKGEFNAEVTNITSSHVLTLLENSLLFQSKPHLRIQIKHFVEFAAQLLFIQGLYGADGAPLKLAGIVNHLHYHEPSNLVFAHLLRSGALRKLIVSTKDPTQIQWSLMILLSHLFARLKLHPLKLKQTFNNSKVILEKLPDVILKAIENYNSDVKFIFNDYFKSVAIHLAHSLGKDNTLPMSKVKFLPKYVYEEDEKQDTLSAKIKSACRKRTACSSFIALSGNDDRDLYTGTMISNIRHEICPGIKVVPLIDTNVTHNSYAVDFYRHGIVDAIRRDNGLRQGSEFARLKDFLLVLKTIVICLEELKPIKANDLVYTNFKKILNEYEKKYKCAFFN